MDTDGHRVNADQIRELALKLDLLQFAKQEMHVVKGDVREALRGDIVEHRNHLDGRITRWVRIAAAAFSILMGGDIWAWYSFKARIEDASRREIEQIRREVHLEATKTLESELARIRTQVSSRIDREFQTTRIRDLVDQKAREYTERQAGQRIAQAVGESVKPYVASASKSAEDLNALRTILFVGERASDGSVPDYVRLTELGRQQTEVGQIARTKIAAINRNLSLFNSPPGAYIGLSFTDTNGKTTEVGQLSTAAIFDLIAAPSTLNEYRHTMMAYAKGKPKAEVAKEALRILSKSQHLPALAATCGILRAIYGDRAAQLDVARWLAFLQSEIQAGR